SATASAYADSLNARSPNEIEQVTTGSTEMPAIIATTPLESTPPDKNAPRGTSEIIRNSTDSRRRRISSSPASASVIGPAGLNGTSQYGTGSAWDAPRLTATVQPGASLSTPLNMVRGSGT